MQAVHKSVQFRGQWRGNREDLGRMTQRPGRQAWPLGRLTRWLGREVEAETEAEPLWRASSKAGTKAGLLQKASKPGTKAGLLSRLSRKSIEKTGSP